MSQNNDHAPSNTQNAARSTQHAARIILGAPQGRSGKTTVTLGLCAALAGRGLAVQPFKKGPDYIDPSWLTEAAGRPCRTLDPFFCGDDETLVASFGRGAAGADICVIEGNHGLYDGQRLPGADDDEENGSTAAVARTLAAPILLVVNTARMGRSIAALVHGYQTYEDDTPIAGVILNNVANSRHEAKLRHAVERDCGIPVLGAFPRSDALAIPDRHLGLIPRVEDDRLAPAVEACRAAAELNLDLDGILAIARSAPAIQLPASSFQFPASSSQFPAPRIGIFRDRAFTFYYPENLEALADAGAKLVFVDAFRDQALPAVDALYIGGGFPEIFMAELSANAGLRGDVKAKAEAGLPIYAECGGLMYLSHRIVWGERSAEMAGVLPCDVEMTARPQGHGYIVADVTGANPFFPAGAILRGHEFHNSRLVNLAADLETAYHLSRGRGLGGGRDGLVYRNVLTSYTHLHAAGAPGWAEGLVVRARGAARNL
ncbi:MAG: cobyrinate a,c-diamide synthase [Chloroflexi bacterium]|nr:cobyrinate a,c-diamide synthase [Chloroflexota bacterium]